VVVDAELALDAEDDGTESAVSAGLDAELEVEGTMSDGRTAEDGRVTT
jgi:hypothetical protein